MHENGRIAGAGDENQSPDFPATIHHTELREALPGEALYLEWNTYLREIARLLEQGHEGRHVLIKDDKIVGIYDSRDAARDVALKLFPLQPYFVHCIREKEPVLRVRGLNLPCRS